MNREELLALVKELAKRKDATATLLLLVLLSSGVLPLGEKINSPVPST